MSSELQVTPGSGKVDETLYVVKPSDTLWTVALEVGLDLDDMPCAIRHDFRADEPLIIGETLNVPELGVICHRIQPGETLNSIAQDYNLSPERIHALPWNGIASIPLQDVTLTPGNHLQIPSGSESVSQGEGFLAYMLEQPVGVSPLVAYPVGGPGPAPAAAPVPDDWPFGSGKFAWPVSGWLSQGYRNDHRAVDIAASEGSFVMSADRGVVVRAGWNYQGYGLFVVIDHNIDYVTLYSHLSEVFVEEGEIVRAGQVLGTVGSTGNSTGPHLHFEIRDFGRRTNPLELLVR